MWGGLEYGVWSILVWCDGNGYGVVGMVRYNLVWYVVWTTLANGKEGRRGPTHEDVHLSFLKVGQKAAG